MNSNRVQVFYESLAETMLWSESDPSGACEFLDGMYGLEDIEPATVERLKSESAEFLAKAGDMIPAGRESRAGHDYWLTRRGHGAGFWDGDWPEHGDALTKLCETFPYIEIEVTDAGQVSVL